MSLMSFEFSRRNLKGREWLFERFFEILPGFTSWFILVGMVVLSFWDPIFAAVLIIAFDFYWFLRLFYMTLFLILAYFRLSVEKETDWMARVGEIDRLCNQLSLRGNNPGEAEAIPEIASLPSVARNDGRGISFGSSRLPAGKAGNDGFERSGFKKRISLWAHTRQLKRLKQSGALPPQSSEIYHLVIFSVAKESAEIVESGIESLAIQKFPAKQILVVIALEEWARDEVKRGILGLQTKYRNVFFDFLIAVHPEGLPGEAHVKGANVTCTAKQAATYFGEKKIPFEHVIVSCFDADTIVSNEYFACLAYHFMVSPMRNRASFQPIPVYHNNIWEASAFARVLDIGASFFQLIEATNPERLVTFSSHSMSFKALVDIGYWPRDMISDDSAIFWKALIHFDGDYRVIPMYVTLSMDVVSGESWWKSAVNVYRQKRRWAWGVENFPIVMRGFLKASKVSLYDKVKYGFKLFEDNVAWATWAFLLTVIGWLPALFAGREFSNSVLYYSAPRITGLIFNLAALALVATLILGQLLLPRKKAKFQVLKRIGFVLEWLFVPIVVVFWSALPALEAQTRLMLGKYMEFWVSEKKAPSTNLDPPRNEDQS